MIGPLEFFAPGVPAPKGSTSSFQSASTGRVVTRGACVRTRPWQANVAAMAALTFRGEPWTGAVAVHLRFVLPRPKGHYRKLAGSRVGGLLHTRPDGGLRPSAPRWPIVKPDGDKLERACWDALVKARVLKDDAIIVLWSGSKVYDVTPDGDGWARRECGVHVRVERLT